MSIVRNVVGLLSSRLLTRSPAEKDLLLLESPGSVPEDLISPSEFRGQATPSPKSITSKPTAAPIQVDMKDIPNTPPIYTLKNSESSPKKDRKLRFFVFGCAGGDASDAQRRVAKLISEADEKPDFIFMLGDNFYDYGVDKEDDPVFKVHEGVYTICGVPCFIIPGNHDHNIWRNGTKHGEVNENKINAQKKHSYLDDKGKVDPEKVKLLQQSEFDLANKFPWIMPHRYFELRHEWQKQIKGAEDELASQEQKQKLKEEKLSTYKVSNGNVELFGIDSNTYLKEYVALMMRREKDAKDGTESKDQQESTVNQAQWLESVAKNPDTIKFLCAHHPLHTSGKRSAEGGGDQTHYVSDPHLEWLEKNGFAGNHNDKLRKVLAKQGLKFKVAFGAHDHFQEYYVDVENDLTVVVAGGGGGKPQPQVDFEEPEKRPYCETEYGYTDVTVDPDNKEHPVVIGFNNVNKIRRQFYPGSTLAHREKEEKDADIILLRQAVLESCDEFFKGDKDKKPKPEVGYLEVWWNWAAKVKKAYLSEWFIPAEFQNVVRIKNYFNEFKDRNDGKVLGAVETESERRNRMITNYLNFLKIAPLQLIEILNKKFQNTAYKSFVEFSAAFEVPYWVPRSLPVAIPAKKAEVKAEAKSKSKADVVSGSPDFRGARFFSGTAETFAEAIKKMDAEFHSRPPSPTFFTSCGAEAASKNVQAGDPVRASLRYGAVETQT